MHQTAMNNAKAFHDAYVSRLGRLHIVEIGSQDVNGSIRDHFKGHDYIGVDFAPGKGVQVILDDPYALPFPDSSVDVVLTSSCFEHSEFFWLTFAEVARILKPGGLCYINVPSNGPVHRWPVDCWRFYPDAGNALARWATRSGYPMELLESCITGQNGGSFNDFIAVFVRDPAEAARHPNRMMPNVGNFENGWMLGEPERRNAVVQPEDQRVLLRVMGVLKDRLRQV
jgi:SAM-dependent methyltransferase